MKEMINFEYTLRFNFNRKIPSIHQARKAWRKVGGKKSLFDPTIKRVDTQITYSECKRAEDESDNKKLGRDLKKIGSDLKDYFNKNF